MYYQYIELLNVILFLLVLIKDWIVVVLLFLHFVFLCFGFRTCVLPVLWENKFMWKVGTEQFLASIWSIKALWEESEDPVERRLNSGREKIKRLWIGCCWCCSLGSRPASNSHAVIDRRWLHHRDSNVRIEQAVEIEAEVEQERIGGASGADGDGSSGIWGRGLKSSQPDSGKPQGCPSNSQIQQIW